jgi:hypothetical protein
MYSRRADHLTLYLGQKKDGSLLQELGGLDARLELVVDAYGSLPDRVEAVRVYSKSNPGQRLSYNSIPHVTLAVHEREGKAKDSNSITLWEPVEPFSIRGILQEKKLWDIEMQTEVSIKHDISLGRLVLKYFPNLKGHEIGEYTKRVQAWMDLNGLLNQIENQEKVEKYIESMEE